MTRVWKHEKSDNLYFEVGEVVDATNSRAGTAAMIYRNAKGEIFVREMTEFRLKFTPHSVIS